MDGPSFVKWIESSLIQNDIPKDVFYAESGISTANMTQWRSGDYNPSKKSVAKVEMFFSRKLKSSAKGIPVPVLGDVAAGIPMDAVENIVDYEEIDAALAATGEFFGLRIKGNSMEPRIREGDVVIVRKQEDADTGDTAVVLVNGSSATVKRIKKEAGGISLIPNNPAFDIQYFSAAEIAALPVTIVGKVVELRGKF